MRNSSLTLLAMLAVASYAGPRGGQAQVVTGYGASVVLDVVRTGEGTLRDGEGQEHPVGRARLRLGGDDEFQLILYGDSTYEFAGTWSGDLRFSPISLDVRWALGGQAEGVGRAWVRDRSWDRDRSFERVELDVWKDKKELALYFDAKNRVVEH